MVSVAQKTPEPEPESVKAMVFGENGLRVTSVECAQKKAIFAQLTVLKHMVPKAPSKRFVWREFGAHKKSVSVLKILR